MSKKKGDVLPIGVPYERVTAPSQGAVGAGDDDASGTSPAGAAKAERDDDDETDTVNDVRSREELDGSLMMVVQVANGSGA